VGFTAETGEDTRVKLMTDGILLAEIQHDRMLRQYDTLIIDEAHERSLNIDFMLGYLNRLLPRRPELKLIITSATIGPERFARHFGSDVAVVHDAANGAEDAANGTDDGPRAGGRNADAADTVEPAPVVEVSGRTYPVEVRYRP